MMEKAVAAFACAAIVVVVASPGNAMKDTVSAVAALVAAAAKRAVAAVAAAAAAGTAVAVATAVAAVAASTVTVTVAASANASPNVSRQFSASHAYSTDVAGAPGPSKWTRLTSRIRRWRGRRNLLGGRGPSNSRRN